MPHTYRQTELTYVTNYKTYLFSERFPEELDLACDTLAIYFGA